MLEPGTTMTEVTVSVWPSRDETCKAVVVEKIATELPEPTKRRSPELEKDGRHET